MHRRDYLTAAGLIVSTAVAGCSSSDGNGGGTATAPATDGSNGEPTNGEPMNGNQTTIEEESGLGVLQTELTDRDVDVYDLFRYESSVVLDYFTDAEDETDEALDEEIVAISRAFAEVVEEFDQNLEQMECVALLNEEEFLDQFQIRAEWARQYAAGDLSDEEYTRNVVDTLEYR